jgi:hypothetical protein
MKTALLIPIFGLMMACQKQEISPALAADPTLVSGQIVAVEKTTDVNLLNPRVRWAINLDPLTLPGWNGNLYPKAKTFTLPDTVNYKVGALIQFHYKLVPRAQETPWGTFYEWMAAQPIPPGYWANAEITLSDIQLRKVE